MQNITPDNIDYLFRPEQDLTASQTTSQSTTAPTSANPTTTSSSSLTSAHPSTPAAAAAGGGAQQTPPVVSHTTQQPEDPSAAGTGYKRRVATLAVDEELDVEEGECRDGCVIGWCARGGVLL